MNQVIKLKNERILLGIFISLLFLILFLSLMIKPEVFLRNKHSSKDLLHILGFIGFLFWMIQLISLVIIIKRKSGIILTENYLIDQSKFEAVGKIKWSDISKIESIKKKSIQINLSKKHNLNFLDNPLKSFLRMMTNWNYQRIIIIDTFLDIKRDDLYKKMITHHKNFKKQNPNERV